MSVYVCAYVVCMYSVYIDVGMYSVWYRCICAVCLCVVCGICVQWVYVVYVGCVYSICTIYSCYPEQPPTLPHLCWISGSFRNPPSYTQPNKQEHMWKAFLISVSLEMQPNSWNYMLCREPGTWQGNRKFSLYSEAKFLFPDLRGQERVEAVLSLAGS